MDAEACTMFATNVRDSACGLNKNFPSGKSCAIAISFRPMSFHCSSTASDGLGAGPGAFFAASWARNGWVAKHAHSKATPTNTVRFIASLLMDSRNRPLKSDAPARQRSQLNLEKGGHPAPTACHHTV